MQQGSVNTTADTDKAWHLLSYASSVCKPLVWLRDTDSCLPLSPELVEPLGDALHTIIELPDAVSALCDKMISTYRRAVDENWVGVGAQPRSTRLGKRTAEIGLIRAREYAIAKQPEFQRSAHSVKSSWSTGPTGDWNSLFSLTEQFIDNLDWGEFVVENARGQVSNLVLESIELLDATAHMDADAVREETGDVFYNLMACCLSLRIGPEHIQR